MRGGDLGSGSTKRGSPDSSRRRIVLGCEGRRDGETNGTQGPTLRGVKGSRAAHDTELSWIEKWSTEWGPPQVCQRGTTSKS